MKQILFLFIVIFSATSTVAQDYIKLNDRAVELYGEGKVDSAIIYLTEAFAIADISDTSNFNQIKDNLIFLNEELGNYDKAIHFYDDWDKLHDRVLELYRNGQYSVGVTYAQRALELCLAGYGATHENYGFNLNSLAILLEYAGQYDQALQYYEKAVAHGEEYYGKMHRYYAIRLGNLAVLHGKTGNYDQALQLYLETRDITAAVMGTDHPDYAILLNNLASLYESMGKYNEALQAFTEAAEVTEASLGKDHADNGYRLHNLAYMHKVMGRYEDAIPLYIQALENRKLNFGENHPLYGAGLSELASTYQRIGIYDKALALHMQSLKNAEVAYGKGHDQYGIRLSNLADYYELIGNYEQALKLYKEVMSISGKVFGKKHPTYAKDINNVASLMETLGSYEEAIELYKESLEITAEVLGKNHLDYATGLNNLGNAYLNLAKYGEAEPILLEALERKALSVGKAHSSYAIPLNNLALLYQYQGKYDKALEYHLEALQVTKAALGEDHQQFGIRLNNTASAYFLLGKHDLALETFKAANKNLMGQIQRVFTFSNEADKAIFLRSIQENFQIYQSFNMEADAVNPEFQQMLYDNQLILKGLLLNSSMDVLKIVRQNTEGDIANKYQEWVYLKRQLADQYSLPLEMRSSNIDSLEATANDLETALVTLSRPFREQMEQSRVQWQDVKKALKPGEVAIEFAEFRQFTQNWTDSVFYVAYVITPEVEYPQLVYLFEETQLNRLLQNSSPRKLYRPRGFTFDKATVSEQLYHLVFDHLQPYLNEVERIYFTPDGKLHQLAFAALSDSSGNLLGEKYHLVQLSTTSRIVLASEEPAKSPALFAGGIQYEYIPQQKNDNGLSASTHTAPLAQLRGNSNHTRGSDWSYLPGTKVEANALYELYKETDQEAQLITDTMASEDLIKSLSGKSPSVMHLATHGFFFEQEEAKNDKAVYSTSENPLLRSGLVLAGGNYTWKTGSNPYEPEDGILTAYEISHLDLSNTDLVVLSACETGLGDIEGSEGVYGLQRAFRMAGVDYLIMSLWEVPDKETAQFMYLFYDNWLKGAGIRTAFAQAQKKMSSHYRYDPEKWAAFVLVE